MKIIFLNYEIINLILQFYNDTKYFFHGKIYNIAIYININYVYYTMVATSEEWKV